MNSKFVDEFASYVEKYAPKNGICVISPIVGQGVLESGNGTTELARNANNYLGIKYTPGRCPSASGTYVKVGTEQNPDGSYRSDTMVWCKFDSMEDCVKGYFEFISHTRYSALKGITEPRAYLEAIKKAGYATSLTYVDDVMDKITKYNLTRFDNKKEETKMATKVIAWDCGHGLYTAGKQTPDGIKEWTLNDGVRDKAIEMLKDYNVKHIFVDNNEGVVDEGNTKRRMMYVNAKVDVAVSIHHNAFKGTWCSATGVEIYTDRAYTAADQKLAECIYPKLVAYTGLKGRGIKRANWTVINQNTVPAVLIEGGFMDNKKDHAIITSEAGQVAYAKAVVEGLIEFLGLTKKKATSTSTSTASTTTKKTYRVQCGAFTNKKNAEALKKKITAAGFDTIIATGVGSNGKALYRVQCGAFTVKKNAEALKKKLIAAGFEAIIA